MDDERHDGMLGGLPQTRPHLRSAKRKGSAADQSAGTKAAPKRLADSKRAPAPSPPSSDGIVGTAVQAAAELAEIGLMASARALRGALARLPRP